MMNNKQPDIYTIDDTDSNQRVDMFLAKLYKSLSRSSVQKQIKAGSVLVNNSPVKTSYILRQDDEIQVLFEDKPDYTILPENIPLDIKYEDDSMLVVNKPSGMLTHPTTVENSGTLVNALLYKYPDNLSDCNGIYRPGIVHRLDRNTSGLLMIAKNNEAYDFLKQKMQHKEIEKKYYAVVCGNIDSDSGTIEADISRHQSKPEKMAVVKEGKPSITHYKVLERLNGFTYLEVTLETGRTHQIRVHMSYIGHPIVNDTLYGGKKLPVNTSEQVLQAYSLKFITPFDLSEHLIEIEPDNDIIKTLNYLRNKK